MPLAVTISLSHLSNAVREQVYNSCAEESLYSAVYVMTKQAGQPKTISIYQNYADARLLVGKFYEDSGTGSLGDLLNLKTGMAKGLADAAVWSNDQGHMYMMPTQAVYDNAAGFKIESYRQLDPYVSSGTWIANIKTELSHGKPLIAVLDSLDGVGRHVVEIERADDASQAYVFKNSWGTGYGVGGYGSLSYSQNTKFQGVYVIDKMGGMDFTYSSERTDVAQLYAHVLERAAEIEGLTFWAGILKSGWTEAQIAQAFIDSPEGAAKYGAMNNSQFVDEFYLNVLNRPADQAGHDYFVGLLNNGTATRGGIYASTLDAISADQNAEAHALVLNKTEVAMYYGVAMQVNGSHHDIAIHALDGVTSDPNSVEIIKVGLLHDLGYT